MRQLFLPACVCLVTWSSAVGSGPSPEPEAEALTAAAARHVEPKIAPEHTADLVVDLAIEFPVPSGVVVNNGEPAGIPLPPIAKPVIARSTEEICSSLADAARSNDLPAPFFIHLLFRESRFKAGAVSSVGAQGIAQFMPDTADDVGLENPFDPAQAIPASARLLRNLIRQFGNLGLAAAAYNAGPKRIQDWLASKGKVKLPEETLGYVRIITGKPVEHWSAADARHPAPKLPRRAPCQDAAGLLAWNGPDAVPLPSPAPGRIVASAKPATIKPATQQLAARKPKPKSKPKPSLKRERIAQR